ncbi:serine/threonine-protein kinase [Mycolicibacterium komossense]|uniref:non-specific serine/threonine protein kinase n=1 Tax=Mycolicibacterium komossense TaxID=1779 RepID=A0ABT3CME6_9MYCO|nr:serine/threonine-protein kinase [Mycolicibacterium komossense]MCV7230630.1 serine/threonine protein kinase [Mycolicibacterium komossense]
MFVTELLGGRYELRGIIGRGGMAEVHEGWDTHTGQIVAIKLLYPGFDTHPDYLRRFWAEAQSASVLHHPNIVTVYGSGEHRGAPFIVMERLPGRSLAEMIAHGPVAPDYVRKMLSDVLAALSTAHAAGILHRDIKPANILFTADGTAQVADFGLAKGPDTHRTDTGQIMGTMAYMSPERLAGRVATVADDLYAVGVVGYEALTGRRAFPEENLVALANAITSNPPIPVSILRPDIDPQLSAIVDRAMTREEPARFASAAVMWAELADVGGDPVTGPIPVFRPPPVAPVAERPVLLMPPPEFRQRRTGRLLLVVGLLVALVVGAIAFVLGAASQRTPSEPTRVITNVAPASVGGGT